MSNTQQTHQYLFGPVASRRYGRSLGVDLAIPKTCSLNCVFCQIGATPQTTVARQELPPVSKVIDELNQWIQSGEQTDFITIAGSGEPTLHKHFGDILHFIRDQSDFRSLLLSNGSLFYLEDVRNQARSADIVKLSLHAWDQNSFVKITNADPSLTFAAIIDGYRKFRDIYSGKIDLEVFVVPGLNDTTEQINKIASIARSFAPDSVYLNSAVRPPADSSVKAASPQLIQELSLLFGDLTLNRINAANDTCLPYSPNTLIELITRHPSSLDQLAEQFKLPLDEMHNELRMLERKQLLQLSSVNDKLFAMPFTSQS